MEKVEGRLIEEKNEGFIKLEVFMLENRENCRQDDVV
jgi:hypothetical protein